MAVTIVRRANTWVGNLSGNVYGGTISGGNLSATNVYATTVTSTTTCATSLSATNAYVSTVSATDLSATNAKVSTVSATDLSATNVKVSTASATTFSGDNVKATTITATNLSGHYQAAYVWNSGAITAGVILTAAHGLGARPNYFQASLVCLTANCNYSTDDEVFVWPSYGGGLGTDYHWGIYADGTYVYAQIVDAMVVPRKTAVAMSSVTPGYWQFRVRLGI